jgi:hypothetical protein
MRARTWCSKCVLAWMAVLTVFSLGGSGNAAAASLDVVAAAARLGSQGLRVTVGSACTGADFETVNGQLLGGSQTAEGCISLSSASTTIQAGADVRFRAGERIAFGSGFRVESGASFMAEIDGTLSRDAYLEDDTPAVEAHVAAGFFIRPDGLALGDWEQFELVVLESMFGTRWAAVVLKDNPTLGEMRIVIEAFTDAGFPFSTAGTQEVVLPAGWSWLSFDWKASSPGGYNGFLRLYLDGLPMAAIDAIENSNGRIEWVRVGAQEVMDGTYGTFDFDEFVSQVAGPVAPPP